MLPTQGMSLRMRKPILNGWFDVFLPEIAQTSCKMIFFIISEDNRLKWELKGQAVELKRMFDVHYCFGMT